MYFIGIPCEIVRGKNEARYNIYIYIFYKNKISILHIIMLLFIEEIK